MTPNMVLALYHSTFYHNVFKTSVQLTR